MSPNNNYNNLISPSEIDLIASQEKAYIDARQSKHMPPSEEIAQEARLAEELRQVNQVSTVYSSSVNAQHDQIYPGFDSRYKLVEKLGDGAFSVVYKALDTKTGEKVAVKVIDKTSLNTSQVCFHLLFSSSTTFDSANNV